MAITTTDAANKGFLCHKCGKRFSVVRRADDTKEYCFACDPLSDGTIREVGADLSGESGDVDVARRGTERLVRRGS